MKRRSLLSRLLRLVFIWIPAAFIVLTLLWVLLLKWVPPVVTPLMLHRAVEYRSDKNFHTQYKWVKYGKISPEMARAVVASEDNLFFEHDGFDRKAIEQAMKENRQGRRLRGASTISQQTAKNVFCSPRRTWLRKGLEAYFTVLIELIWGKRRIMEVYLNVAEMGKGIYGVQAAATAYWGKAASQLTRGQACLLAACLPSPLRRSPVKPGSYTARRAADIASLESKLIYPDWIYHK